MSLDHAALSCDLICPITLELPITPVTAEDGYVYEKEAIEMLIKTHRDKLKSPMTNAAMGQRLFPAVRHKNVIEALVDGGVVNGELADKWKREAKEKKSKDDLLRKAFGGDSDAFCAVAQNYREGKAGFEQDDKMACKWFKKAHAAGNVKGTSNFGYHIVKGKGTKTSHAKGMALIGVAAGNGCDWAAYFMGRAFASGSYGLDFDRDEAIRWLSKSLSDCRVTQLGKKGREEAKKMLVELVNNAEADATTNT
ncbi:expressed unknown protein [Seminavis robusta]|uniref:U-box domain-containing protein n=1 Tax=Seminavis robusta TaxID=568900 RepID=A0A9N8HJY3_9STRA|nr:expressed unknown protein [Seminavis robusta]|eukprot:Sro897_g217530.1 n/a (252) ;mRNA; r:38463-39218